VILASAGQLMMRPASCAKLKGSKILNGSKRIEKTVPMSILSSRLPTSFLCNIFKKIVK
jgi:hypothetical protein